MGMLRALGKSVISVAFCICLALTVLSFSFAQITSESFMRPVFIDIISSQTNATGFEADAVFNKTYYSGCSGLDCLKSSAGVPVFLTSGFNVFLKSVKFYFMIISAVFAVLLVLLAKGIPGKFMSLGYCLAISGLPCLILPSVAKTINMPGFELLIQGFISVISHNFFIILVIGIVLFAVGIVLKFLKFGFKIKRKKKKKK